MDHNTQKMLDQLRAVARPAYPRNTTQTRAAREAEMAMRAPAARFWGGQIVDQAMGAPAGSVSNALNPYRSEGQLMAEADSAMNEGLRRLRSPNLTRSQRMHIVGSAAPFQDLRNAAVAQPAPAPARYGRPHAGGWQTDYQSRLNFARMLGLGVTPSHAQLGDPQWLAQASAQHRNNALIDEEM